MNNSHHVTKNPDMHLAFLGFATTPGSDLPWSFPIWSTPLSLETATVSHSKVVWNRTSITASRVAREKRVKQVLFTEVVGNKMVNCSLSYNH
jgi:hypothetical protein